jgi:hypothetical protein
MMLHPTHELKPPANRGRFTYSNRSTMFEAVYQTTAVMVTDYLKSKAVCLRARSKPHSRSRSDSLDPVDVILDPDTSLTIDGREHLMFLLSNEVMREVVTTAQAPSEGGLTRMPWFSSVKTLRHYLTIALRVSLLL